MYPNAPFGRDGQDVVVYHHAGPGPLGWTIFALQLLLVIGVAWLLASLVVGRIGRRPAPAAAAAPAPVPDTAPLETLHMRYARGEIGRDEYLQARSDLGGEPHSTSEQPTQS
jgi:putative membrane protein